MAYISSYITALLVFFFVDMVWLSTMVPRLYKPTIGDMMASSVHIAPAVAFYLLYPVGLVIFAINPALKNGSISTALIIGATFGLFTYGTYNLTNQATLRNWSTGLTLADMGWGCVLGAITAASAFWITSKLTS